MDPNLIADTREKMRKALEVLHSDIATIRTGKATPSLVENIQVSVYNGASKLKVMEVATVGVQDAHSLVLTPFDASITEEIRKGIMDSGAGLNPSSDGQVIRINIPPLSSERRQELIHLMRQKLENGHVMIRQIRHEALNDLKKGDLPEDENSRLEKEIQRATDEFIGQIDALGKRKEEELLQI
ncbi:MAG: Ribosome-recycling factor [Microgenomates group bacterium GW2011_GWA2_37_6]|nr:MAG: Ribosome-recycling factor [Microgenomates group bacterium GW2011_GWA2_37_6]